MREFKNQHQRNVAAAEDRAGQEVVAAAERAADFRRAMAARQEAQSDRRTETPTKDK